MVKNVFIKKWKKRQSNILKRMRPDLTETQIDQYLDKVIERDLVNPKAKLTNNYIEKNINVNLLDFIDWIEATKPVIAGNGTLFKNQNQGVNPSATMLDGFLVKRKEFKDMLKVYDEASYEYGTYDRLQKSEKVNANAYYGGSGNEAFVFFNLYCAVAVTATAQSLISTTETAFEAFLANNMPYLNLDDCLNFVINTVKDDRNIDAGFLPNVNLEKVLDRLCRNFKFKHCTEKNRVEIRRYLESLSQEDLNRVYYKNNIYEFSLVPKIHNMLSNIYKKCNNFKNPNRVPAEIKDEMEELWEYYFEFVMYNHFIFNRIHRLKHEERKAVIVVDTDSNMIHLGPWVEFTNRNIIEKYDDINDRDEENNLYLSINIMNYLMTQMVNSILNTYCKSSNILKDLRHRINMKNEFLYMRMVLSKVKKRYIGSVRLREGKEIRPELLDIKGHDFVKSSSTPEIKKFFEGIILDDILYSDDIDVATILNKLKDMEMEILQSLKNHEKKYLLPRSVKEADAYKDDPMSQQQFKASVCWNLLFPDTPIEFPNTVYVIKLRLGNKVELENLREKYPEVYEEVDRKIIQSPIKQLKEKRLETIAIPTNLSEIPDWIIDFIDYDTMINDNISKFYPVLESFGMKILTGKGNAKYFSNILDI